MEFVQAVIWFLSTLTLLSHIFLGLLLIYFVLKKILKKNILQLDNIFQFLKNRGLILALIVAIVATLGSLFFSEIAKYTPCELCWFQRIFMYSQSVILGLALIKRRRDVSDYNIALSVIGLAISVYHNFITYFPSQITTTCSIEGTSCAVKFFSSYVYIGIPMMSLTAFILIIVFCFLKNSNKSGSKK